MNEVTSEDHNVNYGVAQGSILGPILFCIYVNDLSEHANMTVQYADDAQLLHTGAVNNTRHLAKDTEATYECIFIGMCYLMYI